MEDAGEYECRAFQISEMANMESLRITLRVLRKNIFDDCILFKRNFFDSVVENVLFDVREILLIQNQFKYILMKML